MDERFVPGVAAPALTGECARYFAFLDRHLLVQRQADGSTTVPALRDFGQLGLPARSQHYLGWSAHHGHCHAVEVEPGAQAPPGMEFVGLRQLFGVLDDDLAAVGGRGVQIVDWWRDHQFCGRCGGRTEALSGERARVCSACRVQYFPRLAPAVIVLIHRGEQFLLARNHHFPPKRYSIIAGFVEPGESLEDAVHREIREEVDLQVTDVRYFGSQPWPFPHSLMLGFTAAYADGQIRLADGELADAGWYTRDRQQLPDLPDGASISRRLIEHYLSGGCGA
jgi:NAD+ diphosphatase